MSSLGKGRWSDLATQCLIENYTKCLGDLDLHKKLKTRGHLRDKPQIREKIKRLKESGELL